MTPDKNYEKFYSRETYEAVGRLIFEMEREFHFKALFGRIAGSKTQGISSKSSDNDFLMFVERTEGNVDKEIEGQVFKHTLLKGKPVEFELGYIYWDVALKKIEERKHTVFMGYPTNFYRSKEEEQSYLPENMPKLMRYREEYPFMMFHLLLMGDSAWIGAGFSERQYQELYALEKTIDALDTFYVRAYGNYVHFMGRRERVLLRKYLYTLSQVWAIQWLLDRGTKPPMMFAKLMDGMELEENLRRSVLELVELNREETLYKMKAYTSSRETVEAYIGALLEEQKGRIASYSKDETFAEVVRRTPAELRQKLYFEGGRIWRTLD